MRRVRRQRYAVRLDVPDKLREATRLCSFYLSAREVNRHLEEHVGMVGDGKAASLILVGAMMVASVMRPKYLQSCVPIVVVRKNLIQAPRSQPICVVTMMFAAAAVPAQKPILGLSSVSLLPIG